MPPERRLSSKSSSGARASMPATLVGSGKAHEIALRAAELDAKVVITLNDLRPAPA